MMVFMLVSFEDVDAPVRAPSGTHHGSAQRVPVGSPTQKSSDKSLTLGGSDFRRFDQKPHPPHALPLVGVEPERQLHARRQGSVWPNQMPSTGWPWCLSLSARCFSPTSRCDTTSTSSLKVGARKALAPDLVVQRVHQVGAAVFGRQRAVGVQAARQGGGVQPFAGPPAAAPARTASKCSSAIVQPAAMAWPPKRSSTPGWRLATRSSASRR